MEDRLAQLTRLVKGITLNPPFLGIFLQYRQTGGHRLTLGGRMP
jgi:hypothetical protein